LFYLPDSSLIKKEEKKKEGKKKKTKKRELEVNVRSLLSANPCLFRAYLCLFAIG